MKKSVPYCREHWGVPFTELLIWTVIWYLSLHKSLWTRVNILQKLMLVCMTSPPPQTKRIFSSKSVKNLQSWYRSDIVLLKLLCARSWWKLTEEMRVPRTSSSVSWKLQRSGWTRNWRRQNEGCWKSKLKNSHSNLSIQNYRRKYLRFTSRWWK